MQRFSVHALAAPAGAFVTRTLFRGSSHSRSALHPVHSLRPSFCPVPRGPLHLSAGCLPTSPASPSSPGQPRPSTAPTPNRPSPEAVPTLSRALEEATVPHHRGSPGASPSSSGTHSQSAWEAASGHTLTRDADWPPLQCFRQVHYLSSNRTRGGRLLALPLAGLAQSTKGRPGRGSRGSGTPHWLL